MAISGRVLTLREYLVAALPNPESRAGDTVAIVDGETYADVATGSGSHVHLLINNGAGAWVAIPVYDANGRLGIGTTSPSDPLHVVGAGGLNVKIENTDDASVTLTLDASAGSSKWAEVIFINDARQWKAGVDGPTDGFRIRDQTGTTNRLLIRTDGAFVLNGGPLIQTGSGSPEGVVTAPVGSLYLRTDGGTGTSLYVKESGTGNTGWVGK